jgi:microcompartment protein CcmL/EutN
VTVVPPTATVRFEGPALGIIELRSIARGYFVLDAMVKRALVTVLRAEPVSSGKFWIAIAGPEAEVGESMTAGLDRVGEQRIDHVYLSGAHECVIEAVAQAIDVRTPRDAIGVLELATLASTVRAADAALKCAEVTLVDLHLARGIGGKGYLVITGTLSDVEAAIDAGTSSAGDACFVASEVLANPDSAVAETPARRR